MKLNIGENLRRLRRAKDVTQEELAQEIGVSFQAVSKWECSDGYPDITLLPALADYFGVTLDELCGYNEQAKENRISEMLAKYKSEYAQNYARSKEGIAFMLDAHREFPNDDRISIAYADMLYYHCPRDAEEYRELKPLCEKILLRCADDGIRKDVYKILFEIAETSEERMEVAKRRGLDDDDYAALWWIYQKSDREKYMYYRQWEIIQKYWELWSIIYWYHEEFESPEDQIRIIERSLKLDYAMFERDDIAAYAAPPHLYEDLARRLLAVDREDEAVKYLTQAMENLEQMQRTQDSECYHDILINRVDYKNCKGGFIDFHDALENKSEYDKLRNRDDFQLLLNRAKELQKLSK